MVKCKNPLFSQKASGSIAHFLTFSERKSGQQVRWQKKQVVTAPSELQANTQSLYRLIYARWLSFNDSERAAYNEQANAQKLQMSGWNLFLKLATANPLTYLGLAGYWSFNNTNLGTVADLSKNGNTGTLKPTWPSDAPQYVDSKNVKMCKALNFDGVDDYVDAGNASNLDLTNVGSLEVWFKVNTKVANGNLVWKNTFPPTFNGYSIDTDSTGGGIRGWISNAGTMNLIEKSVEDVTVGVWHHAVFTWDGSVLKLYLDNVLVATGDQTVNAQVVANPLTIGKREAAYFKGAIDEVRIYNRALSAPEILQIYNSFK